MNSGSSASITSGSQSVARRVADRRVADVAALLHRHVGAGAGDDDARSSTSRCSSASSTLAFSGMCLPPRTPSSAVITAQASQSAMRPARLSGEKPPKHDRMDRADPRAGEHRRRRFGDHRHVDHHPVAAADAVALQQVREAAGLFVQLAVGEGAARARLVGLEDDRRLVAALVEVPVEAIDRRG